MPAEPAGCGRRGRASGRATTLCERPGSGNAPAVLEQVARAALDVAGRLWATGQLAPLAVGRVGLARSRPRETARGGGVSYLPGLGAPASRPPLAERRYWGRTAARPAARPGRSWHRSLIVTCGDFGFERAAGGWG